MAEFLSNTVADFLGSLLAGMVLVGMYVVIQWFLAATDVEIGYAWRFHGSFEAPTLLWVSLDIRNRSRSKTYYVANIAYMKARQPVAAFDNNSIWGAELKPGTITYLEGAPLQTWPPSTLRDCLDAEVHVRLQNGRQFWLRGSGPGQHKRGRLQHAAFWLRAKLEAGSVPVE
jgi:hypothetical protein